MTKFKLYCLIVLFLFAQERAHAENLRIGVLAPFSGKSVRYGQFIREGIELAQFELAKAGRPVDLIFEDDQCNAAIGVAATKKLIELDKVSAIYGAWCSSVVLAEAPIAEQRKTIVLASGVSPKIRTAGDFIFRMQPDTSLYIAKFVPYLVEQKNFKKWAVLAHESDFGIGVKELFIPEVLKRGGVVVFSDTYLPEVTDFRSQLTRVINAKPEALLLPGYSETGLIMKQARELGYKGQFAGMPTFESSDVRDNAGAAGVGAVYPVHFNPDSQDRRVLDFQSRYFARYGHPAEQFAVIAYEGLFVFDQIFKKCGRDSLCAKRALYESSFEGIAERFSFDHFGDPVRSIFIRELHADGFKTLQ